MIKPISIILLVLGICISCKNDNTSRQFFEEHLEANVELCSKPFIEKGMDATKAKSICRCVLTEMFEIDSTFFSMDHEKLNELFETNREFLLEHCEEFREEFLK